MAARPPDEPLAATFKSDALDPEAILDAGSVPWEDVEVEGGNGH